MLYILDTDHVSLLQRQHPTVALNLKHIPLAQRAVTIISLAEQIQGRLASIRRAKTEAEVSVTFHYLIQTVEFFRTLQVLPYDNPSVAEFARLRQQKIRIGTQDLRIAAITLTNHAVVVTRNRRDFRQIPNLTIVDWSSTDLGAIHDN